MRNNIDLADLRYFWCAVQAGSFVAGARLAHISPPAMTKAIQRLEDTLGKPLFDRTTRRVELTAEGHSALAHCQTVFSAVEGLCRAVEDREVHPSGPVQIASMEVFSLEWLPNALCQLVSEYPAVQPYCYESLPSRMNQQVLDGEVDVGFTIGAVPARGVQLHSLGSCPGVLVCGERHPLFEAGQVESESLLDFPFVVPRFLGAEHLPSLDQFPEQEFPRRVGATVELMWTGIEMVRSGSFLGFFPEISVRRQLREGSLRSLAGIELPRFELHAITRKGEAKPAVRWLMESFGGDQGQRARRTEGEQSEF